jgi:hypothetical protein
MAAPSAARDSMWDFQELADEAVADLLQKHGRPVRLKAGLAGWLVSQQQRMTRPRAQHGAGICAWRMRPDRCGTIAVIRYDFASHDRAANWRAIASIATVRHAPCGPKFDQVADDLWPRGKSGRLAGTQPLLQSLAARVAQKGCARAA